MGKLEVSLLIPPYLPLAIGSGRGKVGWWVVALARVGKWLAAGYGKTHPVCEKLPSSLV